MKETIKQIFKKYLYNNTRLPLLAWIVFPIGLVWLSVNYIVGYYDTPTWQRVGMLTQEPGLEVSAQSNNGDFEELVWTGGGLVTLWFDDAWYSQYQPTLSILDEFGFKGTLAVPTDLVGFEAYMTWPHVKKLYHLGWEITSHSRNHLCNYPDSPDEAKHEVEGSLQDLREQGIESDIYVYPCGIVTDVLSTAVKQNYEASRVIEGELNPLPIVDPYNLKAFEVNPNTTPEQVRGWLAQADETDQWLILMFHQIDVSGDVYSASPGQLNSLLQVIADSDLRVVTPSQVLNMKLQ